MGINIAEIPKKSRDFLYFFVEIHNITINLIFILTLYIYIDI